MTIIVREVRSRKVGITGAVRASSNYDLKQNWRLMDLIAAAGGLTAKPNRMRGRLLRHLKTITLDVERANAKPDDDSANVVFQAGDIVLLDDLPPLRDEVSVMGSESRGHVSLGRPNHADYPDYAGGRHERARRADQSLRAPGQGPVSCPLLWEPVLIMPRMPVE